MDFRGLVWKRVWKMTFFGLKGVQDLENRAAHPHQELPEVTLHPGPNCVTTSFFQEFSSNKFKIT